MPAQPAQDAQGPLDELFGDPTKGWTGAKLYDFNSLRYPEDLAHLALEGHYLNFYINVHRSSDYYDAGIYKYPRQWNSSLTGIYAETSVPTGGGTSVLGEGLGGGSVQNGISRSQYRRITQAISLYIPDSMNYSQNIQWENSSVMEMGKKLARGLVDPGGAKSAATEAAAGKLKSSIRNLASGAFGAISAVGGDILGAAGYAINPQLLVLFRGIDFRTFRFDFFFTPRNEKEAESVRNIIQAFRFHSHPEPNQATAGVFWTAPSIFDIEIMHRGKINTNLGQYKTCILKNYDIDYAPYGWSTYKDGMPVQSRLSLTFQEIDVVTKPDIAKGF